MKIGTISVLKNIYLENWILVIPKFKKPLEVVQEEENSKYVTINEVTGTVRIINYYS